MYVSILFSKNHSTLSLPIVSRSLFSTSVSPLLPCTWDRQYYLSTSYKINKTKSWFFEKINKTDKPVTRLTKKKREKTQVNKIRNEKEVIMDNTEIQRIIADYYEKLYGNKVGKLEKMDKF